MNGQPQTDRDSQADAQPHTDGPASLTQLLERLREAADPDSETSFGRIFEIVGTRSFGPVLLVAGLIAFSPISGIPGVPTVMAAFVALVSVQLLLGRKHFWLPRWLLRRRVPTDRLCKLAGWTQRPARVVDGLLRPRLVALTTGPGLYSIAALCLVIAMLMPPLELVPFSATIAGAALAAFGLALVAHDGLLAIVALTLVAGGGGFAVWNLL